jgi:hypothetical protein
MLMATSIEQVHATDPPLTARKSGFCFRYFAQLNLGPEVSWNVVTSVALISLVALWAFWMHATWAAWGNLTIDSGHEMYVPSLLAEGKTLYRDVWFMYPPASPYFNSYLFRIFGQQLTVLYWAGSLSALGSSIFLYLTGMKLSSWPAGWAAGVVVIFQAFQPSLFCFPLPYSFAPVYGCLIACLFLWLTVNAVTSSHWGWTFSAGMAAAAALLLKLEFGTACYAALILLYAARCWRRRSWMLFAKDLMTAVPGLAICVMVGHWMISLRGIRFITQENFMSWPTSFFLIRYGKMWLQNTGFALTIPAFRDAMFRAFLPAGIVLLLYTLMHWKRADWRSILFRGALCITILAYFLFSSNVRSSGVMAALFFPQDMVLYVTMMAMAAWWYFWRHSITDRSLAAPLLLTFTALLAFRILLKTVPWGYAIYYDGPAVLSFLLLLRAAIPATIASKRRVIWLEIAICLACASVPVLQAKTFEARAASYVPLVTEHGTVRIPKAQAEGYRAAIQFMKDKAALGESVMSVPEDTTLYFLSDTRSTTRYYLFTPGVIVPGKMTDDLIRELEVKPVRYLLWSNRIFTEYGVPVFGRDFDRPLGDYLKSHYRRVGPLTPYPGSPYDWHADIWERKPEGK